MHMALRSVPGFGIDMPRNEINIQKAERCGSFAESGSPERSIGDGLPMEVKVGDR